MTEENANPVPEEPKQDAPEMETPKPEKPKAESAAPSGDVDMLGCIKEGFELVKANPVPFMLATLVLSVISSFTFGLLAGPFYVGLYSMACKARKGEKIEVGDAFIGLKENLVPNIIAGLVFIIGYSLGSIAFGIGAYFVGAILLYVIPLVAFKKESIGDAVNHSKDLVLKELIPHVIFFFVASFVMGIGFLACGIGVLFTVPVGIAAMAINYEKRFGY